MGTTPRRSGACSSSCLGRAVVGAGVLTGATGRPNRAGLETPRYLKRSPLKGLEKSGFGERKDSSNRCIRGAGVFNRDGAVAIGWNRWRYVDCVLQSAGSLPKTSGRSGACSSSCHGRAVVGAGVLNRCIPIAISWNRWRYGDCVLQCDGLRFGQPSTSNIRPPTANQLLIVSLTITRIIARLTLLRCLDDWVPSATEATPPVEPRPNMRRMRGS